MDITKEEIYRTAVNLINDAGTLTPQELEMKYEFFKDKFSKLYYTCVNVVPETKTKTLRELSILLNIRQEVKDGKKADIEANVQVGEYMAKQYVYPKTGEPTLEQKKVALQKIMRGEEKKKKEKETEG